MNDKLLEEMINLYAEGALSEDATNTLEDVAHGDPELSHEMFTLRRTVEALRSLANPTATEESYQRIRIRLLSEGIEIQEGAAPEPQHWQYTLPIST